MTINFPVYGYEIEIVWTDDIEDARQKREFIYGPTKERLSKNVDGLLAYHEGSHHATVFVGPMSDTGTIIHECWHAVYRMFKYFGMKLDNENVAYHLGYITNEVFSWIDKVIKEQDCEQKENTNSVSDTK